MITNPDLLIQDFIKVAALAGYTITAADITHQVLKAPHQQPSLVSETQAVYVFTLSRPPYIVLKVGKVGPNSNARFNSQHYNANSSGSNLAKSMLGNPNTWDQLNFIETDIENVGLWLKSNTNRDHFFLKSSQGPLLLALLEIFIQCRLRPIFEG